VLGFLGFFLEEEQADEGFGVYGRRFCGWAWLDVLENCISDQLRLFFNLPTKGRASGSPTEKKSHKLHSSQIHYEFSKGSFSSHHLGLDQRIYL
jgi:hypothetical protein